MQASISKQASGRGKTSSHHGMGWIQAYRRRGAEDASQDHADAEVQFNDAARQRWRQLGEELKSDVAEFNARQQEASFSQEGDHVYRVRSSASGLELVLRADFADCLVRYEFAALNDRSAGAPEGGILSIRQSRRGTAEFYSADERLTSEETRQVLLEPVLFPPQRAA
jgi:hypothetical protein